jgi:anti-anti-sigma factor
MTDQLARVDFAERDGVLVASVHGELDISNAMATGDAIAAEVSNEARALVVDFSELEFLDSSGISMLFNLARRLSERRQRLHLVAPRGEAVARVLDIVEFDRAAPVHSSVEEALTELSG